MGDSTVQNVHEEWRVNASADPIFRPRHRPRCLPGLVPLPRIFAAGPVEGKNAQTEAQLSALRENLARKGRNSYYYAHGR